MFLLIFVIAIIYIMIGLIIFEIDSYFKLDGKSVGEELGIIILWPLILAESIMKMREREVDD